MTDPQTTHAKAPAAPDLTLAQIHADIDTRVAAIRSTQPDWLCGLGCDSCCRRLADIPQLTAAEWALLRDGLAALPPQQLQDIGRGIDQLAVRTQRPIVCPILEASAGACRVYAQRPVACRTYGFYLQRDKGLYCQDIESRVDRGLMADVVWGNQDAIDQRLRSLGEVRPLTEWFASWRPSQGA